VRSYQQQAAELAADISVEQLRAGAFIVVAKGTSKLLAMAATKADAQAAARALYATELASKADDKAAPERPHLDALQRDGLPQRIDRDVTPDDLLQTFGFRGTEFGNWTAQDERQRMLNLAFDGLSDLAEILNVPPAALSLNGTLGLAFGARGGGRFAAHYEPGKLVINLTKLQGGGSLAHEWAHALDHYLGELDRPDAYKTTARGASGWRARRDYTGKPTRRMVREGGRWVMREERTPGNLRPELAAAVDKVMAALYGKALPQAEAIHAAELRVEQLQARRAEAAPAGDATLLASFDAALDDARRKLADAQAGMAQGSVTTDFARQAQKLSGKNADGYWLRPTEMLARAFEAYVFDRLVAMGARSQYLVHGVESERFAGPSFKGNPYPVGEERAAINAAFHELVKTLRTRRTDQGVALFQRRGQLPAFTPANPDRAASNAQVSAVQAAADRITETWKNAPEIRVLESMADAPPEAREADQRLRDAGATGSPSAFILGGKVYLLAGELQGDAAVASAVLHEAAGHLGLRGVFGAELGAVLGELAALREADVRAKAAEYGLDFSVKAERLEAAEELLAELAQTEPDLGLVQRAIAAIRRWLRSNVPMLADLALSDAEIVARFILPARAYVVDGAARRSGGGGGSSSGQAEPGPAFDRRRKAGDDAEGGADSGVSMAGFRAWLEATGPDAGAGIRFTDTVKAISETSNVVPTAKPAPRGQLTETVEVDGQPRPSRNSAGQPLGVDEEAVRDFWRRFAGSVVVDAAGRPQLVYHGIRNDGRRQFKAKEVGPLGAGVYFRESATDAHTDDGADRIVAGGAPTGAAPSYVVLRNPFIFDQAGFSWPQGHEQRGEPASPITGLLVQLLPESKASLALRKARAVPGTAPKLGGTLRETLQAMGHDGLVVRFADPADGQPAYVAFDREQGIRAWQDHRAQPTAAGLPTMVDVDGRRRPTSDALGRPIAASREAIGNFWRWFGDSRAVDAQGRPMPLLHGTGHDISAFKPSRFGLFGGGTYLTGNADSANFYAADYNDLGNGQVMQVYARLRNPYRLVTEPGSLPKWYDAPTDAYFKHPEDYPLGIKLVAEVMPRDSAQRIIDRLMREGSINIGESVTKQLKAMGHDGIVAIEGFGDAGRPLDDAAWREQETEVVVFDAKGIKSATGNRGSFDGGQRDIRFQRRVDPEDQPVREFTLRPFGRAGKAIELLQDRYNRWKQAIDDVGRQGGSITDDNDFYRAEERYWGVVGSQIEDFKDELGGFVRAAAADGLRIEDVALYAYAQHAEERNEWVALRRPDMPDGGSGMTTAEADEILEAARQAGVEAELQRHALTLRRWIQGTRDVLFDGGLIDQSEYDTWIGMFQQYVPLRGTDDDAVAVAGQAAGVRRAMPKGGIRGDEAEHAQGRSSQALQIIEQIAHDRARALIRSGRNNVLRSFARFVLDNPSPSLWEINAVERRRQAAIDEDGYRTVQETEKVIKDGRTITLKDAGEEIHILVKDAKLLEQLQRMGVDERPAWAIGALLSANRWLSRVYTSLSPVFTALNALRDTQAAAVGMIDEIGFLGAPKLFAALPSAWAESFKAEAGKPSVDYQLFKAMGGVTHFHNLTTIEQQSHELEAIVKDAERSALDPRKLLPKAMGLVEALNGGIENATRLAAFKVARDSGKSATEAASIAKNITVNFNRKGTQQLANAWVLFFNPAVQGTTRIAQAMANPKVLATLGVGMMGMAALALRNAGIGDDDDGVAWWDKIPDEVKERNIVIVLPPGVQAGEAVPKSKAGRYLKIPMPYGYNFFAVVANQVVDAWRHSQDPKRGRDVVKAGAKAFSAFTSSWLPSQDLGRAVTADDAESAGKSAVLLLVPDALDPLARIGINQDSFGRPMRPDSRFTRNLPDSSNYFAGQHGTLFQRGASALNQATGGGRFREGLVDVAPSTMEHLARSYGGGPVSFGLDILNALYVRQTIARPELDAKRLPFAKQFIGTIDAETDRMTGYQRLESAEKLIDPIKRAMSAGDGEEARVLHQEAGPVAGLGDAVHQTRQRLGEIIKRERATIDSTTLNDGAKYTQLIELAERRRQALQRFNAAYDRAVLATVRQEPEGER